MSDKQVLHIVTLMSDRNVYGGPVGVALDFQDSPPQGYTIQIYSSFISGDLNLAGLPAGVRVFRAIRVLPVASFSVLLSLGMLLQFVKHRRQWKIVHIHLARDLITMPIALFCVFLKIPFVVQPHGMLHGSKNLLVRFFDSIFTGRILRKASSILFLTSQEEDLIKKRFNPNSAAMEFTPNAAPKLYSEAERSEVFQVSFVARLHPRKRVGDFVQAAKVLDGQKIHFGIAGHDQGDESKLLQQISNFGLKNISYWGPVSRSEATRIMAESHILILPSSQEPYPLSIIESLTLGTPVAITDECGLADLIKEQGGGIVFPVGDVQSLVDGILHIRDNWPKFHLDALELSREFSREKVNEQLVGIYGKALNERL